ncbi:unnamed protein product [Rangifer tarandus platyrhynchus]|uniref:Uncharacterized protein n=1 Tax=Rangifer tarandus platyrhynchus TaxID=3082113 RepID=A0AC59ZFL3_RANTA
MMTGPGRAWGRYWGCCPRLALSPWGRVSTEDGRVDKRTGLGVPSYKAQRAPGTLGCEWLQTDWVLWERLPFGSASPTGPTGSGRAVRGHSSVVNTPALRRLLRQPTLAGAACNRTSTLSFLLPAEGSRMPARTLGPGASSALGRHPPPSRDPIPKALQDLVAPLPSDRCSSSRGDSKNA